MTLAPGTRLGPYEILAPLGAGGMGEVYRARDGKLDRIVALKVLPERVAMDAEALGRFEREAKAVAALSHPNILAIHDFGSDAGTTYAAMELLEGDTLRARLQSGALPVRKAGEIAVQVANGLAAAHDRGIVHRDLKPENVFITHEGRVKILDFGLARATTPLADQGATVPLSKLAPTSPGIIVGTVGYMAPEQIQGLPVDPRSDLFALGVVLFEMITGKRAFERDTAPETMTAILREDPPAMTTATGEVLPALETVVRRCLEKRADERFQSARDLAFAIEATLAGSSSKVATGTPAVRPKRRIGGFVTAGIALAALVIGIAVGMQLGHGGQASSASAPEPSFKRLTFANGLIRSARFAPDGKTVIYGAAWDGQPIRLYLTRTESPESTPLSLPPAEIFALSSTGELAISLGHTFTGWMGQGTLARAPLLGGAARPVLENVREADWTPDGTDLAIVRRVGNLEQLEFPAGNVLLSTSGFVSHIRFSPRGDRIAFADHPVFADDRGVVAVVDLHGNKRVLSKDCEAVRGVAWSPAGDEVWFTAARGTENMALRAVDFSGHERILLHGLTHVVLYDVARDGRLLLGRETSLRQVEALVPGEEEPHDFTLAREGSVSRWIADDGSCLTLSDQSEEEYATYLRRTDGSPPVRLGRGEAYGRSPDGAWVLAVTPDAPSQVLLHPTGAGQTRELENPDSLVFDSAAWMPDGKTIVLFGQPIGGRSRGYLQSVSGGPPRAFTSEGTELAAWWTIPVTPDGKRVLARDPGGRLVACPVAGGDPEPILGLEPADAPLGWAADSRSLFIGQATPTSWTVERFDPSTGRREPWTEIRPHDVAGLRLSMIQLTPNGRFWVHSYSRLLTDLYLAEGLR
jgi:eukaryotic-like serine/threonine-protein kinase